jgi:hypothetical protein
LLQRDRDGYRQKADGLLRQALQAAAEMQLPEANQILGIMDHFDLLPEEIRQALAGETQ